MALAAGSSDGGWLLRPLHLVVLLWLGSMLACARMERGPLAVLALSITARAISYSPRVHMHFSKAYAALVDARGLDDTGYRYGDGFAALYGLFAQLLGGTADHVHLTSALLSALVAPFAFWVAGHLGGVGAAWAAGTIAALLPLPLAMAPTETRFVAISLLQITALLGLLRHDTRGDVLLITSAGLLAHLRPLQVAVALVLCGLAYRDGRTRASLGIVALLAWRALDLTQAPPGSLDATATEVSHLGDLLEPASWVGWQARAVWLDPWRTPIVITLLGLVGMAHPRTRRAAAPLTLLTLLGIALYSHQPADADRLRFELPTQSLLAVLAGLGLSALPSQRPARAALVAAALVSSWPARAPHGPWVWQTEYSLVHEAVAWIPEGGIVRYDPAHDGHHAFQRWANPRSPGRWLPLEGPERPGEWRWVGLADVYPEAHDVPWHRLEPVRERELGSDWGGIVEHPPVVDRVGLYEVAGSP